MINTGHPWSDFLLARKLAIEWLLEQHGYSFEIVAQSLSMDARQVELIHLTPVESIK